MEKVTSEYSIPKKVCVVGAGLSGLVAERELRREGLDVAVLEQRGGVGGQWLYDTATDGGDQLGEAGVTSSVYASLRLNTPREVVGFSDFPFRPSRDGSGDARRFPVHGEFLKYIKNFCDEFGLMNAVRLNTRALRVAMAPARDGCLPGWMVRSKNGEVETEEVFDAVVVASGHFSQPRLPAIDGMDKWKRRQLHCHSYRVPDSFHGEVVVIVGCRVSGKEIAMELCHVAKEVHLSAKSTQAADMTPAMSKMLARHDNLHLHPQIDRMCEDGRVVFDDGSCVVADTVMYCTGYAYSFPFLETEGHVTVDDNRVGPLFEHVFPPALAPSLSFVGIPNMGIVPLFNEVQAREAAGVPKRRTHDIFFDLEYCDEYGERNCGFPRLEEWKKELMGASIFSLRDNPETFRDVFHDADLVRDALRLYGWSPREPQDNDDAGEKQLN
ncbi:hypothetical protein GUJ93_ZPchr0007g4438 [Zizania palustris]|uniref:Flavin-containing monooxygenase n=1 Tax=Zizania palustris TaxID=103762 RepID=A0A8J5STM4_ZIZPA|nr:hypothetical protein GUJ93_ZPchr0007g4438 [Zizania palustris]